MLVKGGDDVLEQVEAMLETLRAENVRLHGAFVEEKESRARALMGNVRLQRAQERMVDNKIEIARHAAADAVRREKDAELDGLKDSLSSVTMRASAEIQDFKLSVAEATAQSEQLEMELQLRNGELAAVRKEAEDAKYEGDRLQARVARLQRERERHVNSVEQVGHGVKELEARIAKNAAYLKSEMEDLRVRMCTDLGRLLAQQVVEARDVQTRAAGVVVQDYERSRRSRLSQVQTIVRMSGSCTDVPAPEAEQVPGGSSSGASPSSQLRSVWLT